MDPNQIKVPPMKDLNIDNITENTVIINSQSSDQRVTYVMERLVTHLHDFARETRLSTNEWMAALNFLVKVGQISSDVRHVWSSNCIPLASSLSSCSCPLRTFIRGQLLRNVLTWPIDRNLSSSPISSVSPSSSTQSTTPNPPLQPRALC